MAQEGSKMPSEGPKEHQEGPTPQIPLNASTLPMNSSREGAPELRRRDVSHILTLGSCHYWDAPAPLTHSLSRLPRALTSTDTQTYSNSGSLTLSLTHTQTHSHSDPLTHRPLIIPIAYGPPVLPEYKQYKINVFPFNMDVLSSTSQNVWQE